MRNRQKANRRQEKKNKVSLHIEVQKYLRANGTYPRWKTFPIGVVVKWFPRSAHWRTQMRKLGASVAADARTIHDFTSVPMRGCEGMTWKEWCAMWKKHRASITRTK